MAAGTSRTSERMSTTSALSMAMSVPAPMAMPTSARASAGASLMPSPTMATRPCAERRRISRSLSSGSTPAMTSSAPTRRWIACAVRSLSPVSITVRKPMARNSSSAAALEGLTVSATATRPHTLPPQAKNKGVLPSSASSRARGSNAEASTPACCINLALPANAHAPPTFARTPPPATCSKAETG